MSKWGQEQTPAPFRVRPDPARTELCDTVCALFQRDAVQNYIAAITRVQEEERRRAPYSSQLARQLSRMNRIVADQT